MRKLLIVLSLCLLATLPAVAVEMPDAPPGYRWQVVSIDMPEPDAKPRSALDKSIDWCLDWSKAHPRYTWTGKFLIGTGVKVACFMAGFR